MSTTDQMRCPLSVLFADLAATLDDIAHMKAAHAAHLAGEDRYNAIAYADEHGHYVSDDDDRFAAEWATTENDPDAFDTGDAEQDARTTAEAIRALLGAAA
jgi:hypothetical protein